MEKNYKWRQTKKTANIKGKLLSNQIATRNLKEKKAGRADIKTGRERLCFSWHIAGVQGPLIAIRGTYEAPNNNKSHLLSTKPPQLEPIIVVRAPIIPVETATLVSDSPLSSRNIGNMWMLPFSPINSNNRSNSADCCHNCT